MSLTAGRRVVGVIAHGEDGPKGADRGGPHAIVQRLHRRRLPGICRDNNINIINIIMGQPGGGKGRVRKHHIFLALRTGAFGVVHRDPG
jgi:hypothetical protein